MALRASDIVRSLLVILTAVCSSPARAVPVTIDLTINYSYPPNPAAPLNGTVEFWQDINGFISWGDTVSIGPLSSGQTFNIVLFPPSPCNGSPCDLGFSFEGSIGAPTGAITTYALENLPTFFPTSLPIIPIADFFPPNPCASTCQTNGVLVADDAPTEAGTWAVTIAPTPLPAAWPLFATGLGALGLLGWRRKRKAQAVAA